MSRLAAVLCLLVGCASGPQVVPAVPVVNIACNWTADNGAMVSDCDCLVDRSAAAATPNVQGVDASGANVSPNVDVHP